jgi:hypothetical protein
MRYIHWNRPRRGGLMAAGLAVVALAVPGAPAVAGSAAQAARVPGPVLKLEAAQHRIKLDSFGGKVFLDPGIWLAALGSPLQFDTHCFVGGRGTAGRVG